MKVCNQCNEAKSFDNFYKQRMNKDKLTGQCKACLKQNRFNHTQKKIKEERLKYFNA